MCAHVAMHRATIVLVLLDKKPLIKVVKNDSSSVSSRSMQYPSTFKVLFQME